ncbi:30S ribosome-binding factor RbfA [Ferrovibrio xuzhouensis]|uniref:Ribosome-binding factor A n=1 Tax=Ferrovibrio xuzhouensis TaxID=1576914 RepID=A0ABV7VFM6_9PROT
MAQRGRRAGDGVRMQQAADAAGGRTQRQLRVGEELRHVLSQVLMEGHFRDPDLVGMSVTVTEVRVSPDLKAATAFVMPLGGQATDKIIAALNRAQAFIRGEAARRIDLRFAPSLSFKPDHSFDEADHVNRLLQRPEVQADLRKDESGEE